MDENYDERAEQFQREYEMDCHIGEVGYLNGEPIEDYDFSNEEWMDEIFGNNS